MPKKIRELKAMLLKAGFTYRPGKGSHTVWSHPQLEGSVTLSGQDGTDAKRYQEKDVRNALEALDNEQEERE
ncbi:MAG: type II toxin-antitoxin system HicA family toxin [Spirulina sp.]